MIKLESLRENEKNDTKEQISTVHDEKYVDIAKKYVDNLFDKSPSELYEDMIEEVLFYDENDIVIDFDINNAEITNAVAEIRNNWSENSEDEQMSKIENFSNVLAEKLGLEQIPKCNFYFANEQGAYGFYSREDNSININTLYLGDYKETVNTVAHELRHAYQHQRAEIGETYIDELYKCNLDVYQYLICDEDGYYVNFPEYYYQFVEVDARVFAKIFDV